MAALSRLPIDAVSRHTCDSPRLEPSGSNLAAGRASSQPQPVLLPQLEHV